MSCVPSAYGPLVHPGCTFHSRLFVAERFLLPGPVLLTTPILSATLHGPFRPHPPLTPLPLPHGRMPPLMTESVSAPPWRQSRSLSPAFHGAGVCRPAAWCPPSVGFCHALHDALHGSVAVWTPPYRPFIVCYGSNNCVRLM